jgi:hypothetical protein
MPNNYILLETITLTQSASSVTFDNLPTSGYTDLKIVASTRTDYSGFLDLNMFFNGNASSGYSFIRLFGDGATSASNNSTSAGVVPSPTLGTTSTSNTFANNEIYIPNYRSSVAKSVSIDGVTENNATTSYTTFTGGRSTLSTPITSISFGLGAGNFVANTTFSLYGIAAFGTTPTIAPRATGGDIVATDGTHWYHAFITSGFFTPQVTITCDVLQIAGGGGGGGQGNNNSAGGGGGAGGLRYFASQVVNSRQSVLVGAGGVGVFNASGTNGSNSQFGSLTVSTGGGAGGSMGIDGFAGGSGGGAGTNFQSPARSGGAASPSGQGNAGGNSTATAQDSNFNTGGGGGAGGAGGNGSAAVGGNGGLGLGTYSSWATATNTGASGFYAGGGGGPGFTTNGTGSSGGGNGSFNGTPSSALASTGSGGGGGAYKTPVGVATTGGNGGSGIIIVRYPVL